MNGSGASGSAQSDGPRLLRIDLATCFVLNATGRIWWENEPTPSPGPRLWLAGCAAGNVVAVRADVTDAVAARIQAIVSEVPAWSERESPPDCLPDLIALLKVEAPIEQVGFGVIYRLPVGLAQDPGVRIVSGDTPEGERLLARIAAEGPPEALVEAGFLSVRDFWPPWCVAMQGDQIAAMAFAARLGEAGAEVGVYTFPGFRGRGLAAAVTAAWSALPSLAARALFYSHDASNASSAQVTQRLGLRRIGRSVRVG